MKSGAPEKLTFPTDIYYGKKTKEQTDSKPLIISIFDLV